ncbi:unnamed protein product [Penicillium glandicola]
MPEERRTLVNIFFDELNRLDDGRWLLVIDGVNHPRSSSAQDPLSVDIHNHIHGLIRGSILLTSQRRDLVERYHPLWELKGLKDEDAKRLLNSQIDSHLMEGRAKELISLQKGMPSALRLAISVISRYRLHPREYLEMQKEHNNASEVLGTHQTLYRSMELSLDELERSDPIVVKVLTLFSFLEHSDLWFEICYNAVENIFPRWLQDLARNKTPFRKCYPLLADLSFIELKFSSNGKRIWEIHPAIQAVLRQRAQAREKAQKYVRCSVSLVAAQVPRSSEANAWVTMRRLLPHVQLHWIYIKEGKWGPDINFTELECLARVFRQLGHHNEASTIYRMITVGLQLLSPTPSTLHFLADVLANHGLVYTYQRKFESALHAFDKSSNMMRDLKTLTLATSMFIMYNKGVVFMMMDRLDEAEELLQNAATYFSNHANNEDILVHCERRSLYLRILNDIGEVLLRKGSASEAFKVFQHVYHIQGSRRGEPYPAQMSLQLNIGRALTKLGNFSKARELLLKVISVYTEWWGRHHPETMRGIDELALTFLENAKEIQSKGEASDSELQNAAELWNEALDFYCHTDVNGSATVARIEANLIYLYSGNGSVPNLYEM